MVIPREIRINNKDIPVKVDYVNGIVTVGETTKYIREEAFEYCGHGEDKVEQLNWLAELFKLYSETYQEEKDRIENK